MLLRKVLGVFGSDSVKKSSPLRRRPLRLEPLENRQMLSITLFVDADCSATDQDGLDWASAYSDLQDALNHAAQLNNDGLTGNDVETIWIAEGTYTPTLKLELPPTIQPNTEVIFGWPDLSELAGSGEMVNVEAFSRYGSFYLVDGISLYGGFAGTETSLDQRDPAVHETILSGDLGILDNPTDNAYSVVYCTEGVTATLDGLTIMDGYANNDWSSMEEVEPSFKNSGGGVYNLGNLTITDTTIRENVARYGSGVYNEGTLTVTGSTIEENVLQNSIGFRLPIELPTILDYQTEFSTENLAETVITDTIDFDPTYYPIYWPTFYHAKEGGGIYNQGTLEVVDSTISENMATVGGGISNHGTLSVENTVFQENKATYGAGIANDGELEVARSQFQKNRITDSYNHTIDFIILKDTDGVGAGIYNRKTGTAHVSNSLFAENHGQGIATMGSIVIVNSTIVHNKGVDGAGIYAYDNEEASVELYNSIVAGNETCPSVWGYPGEAPDIRGYVTGANNLIGDDTGLLNLTDGVDGNQIGTADAPLDPMLRIRTDYETGLNYYNLRQGSPAIDAGNNALAIDSAGSPLTTDLYGDARIAGGTVDIGAVENIAGSSPAQVYVVTSLEDTIAEDGVLTFIEAFLAANSNHAVGDAVAGSFLEQDVIQFADGLIGTFFVDGELVISDDLRIESSSPRWITFDAQGTNRVFTVAPYINATLRGITVTGGAAEYGAGIYNYGTLRIVNSVILDNAALDDGGGIYNEGTLTIANSSILDNSTPDEYEMVQGPHDLYILYPFNPRGGGGVYNTGTVSMVNVTVAGNSAKHGGGLYNDEGTMTVTNSTISENSVGLHCEGLDAVTILNNTIIAGNTEGDVTSESYPIAFINCWPIHYLYEYSEISGHNNLIGDGSGQNSLIDGVDGNQIGTAENPIDPMMSELLLFANGQRGYRLRFDSSAVNAGANSLLPNHITTDIEGKSRVVGEIIDIGAYEFGPYQVFPVEPIPENVPTFLPTDKNAPKENIPHFEPPTRGWPRTVTVPRRVGWNSAPVAGNSPALASTDAVECAVETLAAVAKEIETAPAKKSATDTVFALDMTLYDDFE